MGGETASATPVPSAWACTKLGVGPEHSQGFSKKIFCLHNILLNGQRWLTQGEKRPPLRTCKFRGHCGG
jgi:hypothetical protein